MFLEIQHETQLHYHEPVTEWVAEVRMEPVSDPGQTCRSFHLKLSQPAGLFRYQDGFGNSVHHFNLLAPHREVHLLAASLIETHRLQLDLSASEAVWPVDVDAGPLELLDFLWFRGPVAPTALLDPLLESLRPSPNAKLGDLVLRILQHLRARFTYAPDVTRASSPIADILAHGKGVCQDFAHLMIAVLRSFHVPARYVSGYIHRPNKESQSHAWCEVWLPDLGWVGVDPTNECVVGDHFVKVAVGRDFTDVPPNKGVYQGRGEESIRVRVETRELNRLPSLSWQDQLPPLDLPLTALHPTRPADPESDEQAQQQ